MWFTFNPNIINWLANLCLLLVARIGFVDTAVSVREDTGSAILMVQLNSTTSLSAEVRVNLTTADGSANGE